MINRIFDWMSSEPAIGLLMMVVTITLFVTALRRIPEESKSVWPWFRRIVEASISAILFLGLLWGFRSVLVNNTLTFYATHGSVSDASLKSAQSIWGRPHVQREMTLVHYITVVEQQEIPQDDPSAAPKYKNVTVRKEVEQNPILGFTGQFDLSLSEREKGYALYSGFVLNAKFTYDVTNDSEQKTEAEFVLPLSDDQTIFDGFQVFMDGKDMASALRYGDNYVRWMVNMEPHQKSQVKVTYRSRGMDYFYYQISTRHEVANFDLTVTIDKLPVALLNYPDGTLSPTTVNPTSDGRGSTLNWKLDHTITTAGMGVALIQPQQPGADVFRVLNSSALALTMLIGTIALVLLLLNQTVNFLDLALMAAIYAAQFFVMASLSDSPLKFGGAWIAGAALSLVLVALLLRRQTFTLSRWMIFGLFAFFAVIYPLSGLLTDLNQANTFDLLTKVGLVVFVAALVITRRGKVETFTFTAN
jgi:hypothetical protein